MRSSTVGRSPRKSVARTEEARAYVRTEARKHAVLALPTGWVAAQMRTPESTVGARTSGATPAECKRTIETRELLMGGLLAMIREQAASRAEVPASVLASFRVEYRCIACVRNERYFLVLPLVAVSARLGDVVRVHTAITVRDAAVRLARKYLMLARRSLRNVPLFPYDFDCYVIDPGPLRKGASRASKRAASASAPPATGGILARLRPSTKHVARNAQTRGAPRTPRGTRLPLPSYAPPESLPPRVDEDRTRRRNARSLTSEAAVAAAALRLRSTDTPDTTAEGTRPRAAVTTGRDASRDKPGDTDTSVPPRTSGEASDDDHADNTDEGENDGPVEEEVETGAVFYSELAKAMEFTDDK